MSHSETTNTLAPPHHSAGHYRGEAARFRAEAEQEKNRAIKLQLLAVALSFDGLAATVEMVAHEFDDR